MKKESSIQVGPIYVDDLSSDEIVDEILKPSEVSRAVFNLNAHALNLTFKKADFRECLNKADICFCDGFGIKILSALFSKKTLKNRNTPPDFIEKLHKKAFVGRKKVYFLGDRDEVVKKYAKKIESKYPGMVAGFHHGYFLEGGDEERSILLDIQEKKPDILIVGMGMPRQELWACRHKNELPVCTIFVVGALFAWESDSNRKRGPRWATDMGMEWLFRLFYEFGNVWKRYLLGLPEVFIRMGFRFFRIKLKKFSKKDLDG